MRLNGICIGGTNHGKFSPVGNSRYMQIPLPARQARDFSVLVDMYAESGITIDRQPLMATQVDEYVLERVNTTCGIEFYVWRFDKLDKRNFVMLLEEVMEECYGT